MALSISIVICAHNEEHYIAGCIESILNNNDGNLLEIIVVDNCSTDRTAEIARRYPVKLVQNDHFLGLTASRRVGLLHATGNLTAYVDCDNKINPQWFTIIQREFLKSPSLICLSGPYRYPELGWAKYWTHRLLNFVFSWAVYMIFGVMLRGGNFVIRPKCADDFADVARRTNFHGEDVMLAQKFAQRGRCKYVESFWAAASIRHFQRTGFFRLMWQYFKDFISIRIFNMFNSCRADQNNWRCTPATEH
ncbi:MAG: glycosyltransferase family A protein [Candidatus Peribacteraceae bacterium]|nr:glycosyltransferase family A protein [Candidatus Peribacteraceae bacterium]